MPEQGERLPLEITRSSEFTIAHISGVTGGLSPEGGEMNFYIDMVDPKVDTESREMVPGRVVRTFLFDVRMSTELFRSINQWMAQHVEHYEAQESHEGSGTGE